MKRRRVEEEIPEREEYQDSQDFEEDAPEEFESLPDLLARSPRAQVARLMASETKSALTRGPVPLDPEYGIISLNLQPLMLRLRLISRNGPRVYRGMPSPIALMKQCDIEKITAWQLVKHPETIRQMDFRTLAKLCYGLGCNPADLLVYTPPSSRLRQQYRRKITKTPTE